VPIVHYKTDVYGLSYCVGKMAGAYASKVALTVTVALTVATADNLRHSPPLWEPPHVEQQQYPPMDDSLFENLATISSAAPLRPLYIPLPPAKHPLPLV